MAQNFIKKEPIYAEIIFRETIVNTSNFSADDLDLFIDSMETIARVQRERKERRLRRRNLKLNAPVNDDDVRSIQLPPAEDSSEAEEDSKLIYPKESHNKLSTEADDDDASPGHSSDENYFSGASRSESPTEGSDSSKESIDGSPPPSVDSGTESESGVYKLRPRSYAMTSPKYRTTRARIIGLVLKREYADGGSQDELEKQERRERLLEGLLREKDKCESLRITTKECTRKPIPGKTAVNKQPTAEMRFIDKALRYLTL